MASATALRNTPKAFSAPLATAWPRSNSPPLAAPSASSSATSSRHNVRFFPFLNFYFLFPIFLPQKHVPSPPFSLLFRRSLSRGSVLWHRLQPVRHDLSPAMVFPLHREAIKFALSPDVLAPPRFQLL